MAVSRTCVIVDAQVHERWSALRTGVSERELGTASCIGLQVMLCILLDHWDKAPPDREWLKRQLELYPHRGRPRRSQPADMTPRVALRKSETKGHEIFTSRAFRGYKVFCKHCDMVHYPRETHDGKPTQTCPTVSGGMSIYARKVWTRRELIEKWKFEVDEVQWLPEDPPQP